MIRSPARQAFRIVGKQNSAQIFGRLFGWPFCVSILFCVLVMCVLLDDLQDKEATLDDLQYKQTTLVALLFCLFVVVGGLL